MTKTNFIRVGVASAALSGLALSGLALSGLALSGLALSGLALSGLALSGCGGDAVTMQSGADGGSGAGGDSAEAPAPSGNGPCPACGITGQCESWPCPVCAEESANCATCLGCSMSADADGAGHCADVAAELEAQSDFAAWSSCAEACGCESCVSHWLTVVTACPCQDDCDAQYPEVAVAHQAVTACAYCGQCSELCSEPDDPQAGCFETVCAAR